MQSTGNLFPFLILVSRGPRHSHISLQAAIFLPFVSTPSLPLPRFVCKAQFLSETLEFFAKRKGKGNKLKEHPHTKIPTHPPQTFMIHLGYWFLYFHSTQTSWWVLEMTNPECSVHFPVLWDSCQRLQPHWSQMSTSDLQVPHISREISILLEISSRWTFSDFK